MIQFCVNFVIEDNGLVAFLIINASLAAVAHKKIVATVFLCFQIDRNRRICCSEHFVAVQSRHTAHTRVLAVQCELMAKSAEEFFFFYTISFVSAMSEYKRVSEWPELVLELLNESDERLFVQQMQFRQAAPDVPIFGYAQFDRKSELDVLRQRVTAAPLLRLLADVPVIPAKHFFAASLALRRRNVGIGLARGEESELVSRDKQFLSAVLQTLHFLFWDALVRLDDSTDSCGSIVFAVDEENREAGTRMPLRGLVVGKFKRSPSGAGATFSTFLLRARSVYPAEQDLDIFTLETQPDFSNPLRNGSRNAIQTVSLVRSRQPPGEAVVPADRPYSAMAQAYSTSSSHDVLSADIALLVLDMRVSAVQTASAEVLRAMSSKQNAFELRAMITQTVLAELASTSFGAKNDAIDAVLLVTQYFRGAVEREPRYTILRNELPNNVALGDSVINAATQLAFKIGRPQWDQGIIDITVQLSMARYKDRWPLQLFDIFTTCNLSRLRFRIVRKMVHLFPAVRAFLERYSNDKFYATFLEFLGDRDTGLDYDPNSVVF